ncbi:Hypothetical predicted protein [Octopus vulgaris]|uniref:Uncharacterized protein n=1 Tax=Octopus vulgaris TaxID=6645 RepID=A0AA36EY75_OCTVU|nr:Hypothetical predicted protein [Octopus vulgaris]
MLKPPILYQTQQPWILIVILKKIHEYNYGENDRVDQNDSDSDDTYFSTRRHNKSAIGMRFVTGTNVSTNKAVKICKQLSEEG